MARPRKIGTKALVKRTTAPTVQGGNGAKRNGRPTKYDSKYCDKMIAYMSDGASLAEFAIHIGVARATLDNWFVDHEEFLGAKKEALWASQAWWEELGRRMAMGEGPVKLKSRKLVTTRVPTRVLEKPATGTARATYKTVIVETETLTEEWVPAVGGSTAVWIFNMINRFPDDWRQRNELSGPGGAPIPINSVTLHANLDDAKLRQLREIALLATQPRVVN